MANITQSFTKFKIFLHILFYSCSCHRLFPFYRWENWGGRVCPKSQCESGALPEFDLISPESQGHDIFSPSITALWSITVTVGHVVFIWKATTFHFHKAFRFLDKKGRIFYWETAERNGWHNAAEGFRIPLAISTDLKKILPGSLDETVLRTTGLEFVALQADLDLHVEDLVLGYWFCFLSAPRKIVFVPQPSPF